MRWRRMVAIGALAVAAGGVLAAAPVEARSEQHVDVVGDSLLRMTYEAGGTWHVRGYDGRALHGSQRLLKSVTAHAPDVLVIALGTNDVAYNRSARVMALDIRRSLSNTATVPCVVFTTVTIYGTPFYNRTWAAASRRFNRLLWQSGVHVANWAGALRHERGYLLADGVHLSEEGKRAYDAFLRTSVDDLCAPQGP